MADSATETRSQPKTGTPQQLLEACGVKPARGGACLLITGYVSEVGSFKRKTGETVYMCQVEMMGGTPQFNMDPKSPEYAALAEHDKETPVTLLVSLGYSDRFGFAGDGEVLKIM